MTARGTSASFAADGFGRSEVGNASGGTRVVNGGGDASGLSHNLTFIHSSLLKSHIEKSHVSIDTYSNTPTIFDFFAYTKFSYLCIETI